ncbi:proline-rich receptor-like protein kinase PERK9 [Arachis stenosperma]|uniref:proline-rich receptor-like protein kinase PERK9 n=1 Tax=Arachis stenosperma TaxID=217475 RepID=UPI0025AC11BD|nr:proline-rich receptor-like protein kinase PERK9 [Arachis stenosperma]
MADTSNTSVVGMEVLISPPQPVTQHLLQLGSPPPLPQPVTVTLHHPATNRELTAIFSSDVLISEVLKVAEVYNSSVIGMEVRNVSQPPASLPLPVSQPPVSLSQLPPPLPQPASPPMPLPQPVTVTLHHPATNRELTATFSSEVLISEVLKVAEVYNSSVVGMEVRNVSQPPASLPLPVSQPPVSLSQLPPPLPQPASPPTPLPQPASPPPLLQPVSQPPASLPVSQPPPPMSQPASPPTPLPQPASTPPLLI